jgi:hypothetical protein
MLAIYRCDVYSATRVPGDPRDPIAEADRLQDRADTTGVPVVYAVFAGVSLVHRSRPVERPLAVASLSAGLAEMARRAS